jgi:(p)ppGpp synthase/HD superfamily hydrolase
MEGNEPEASPARRWDLAFVQEAARYAETAHADDRRKGTDIPYLSHLWGVAALVMDHGGDDRQVAAALLHDVVEDHGGEARLADVRSRFGDDVADMVADLSDSVVDTTAGVPKPPWEERKRAYLDHLTQVADRSALVSAADKLHNLRAITSDYRMIGSELWRRFTVHEPGAHLWYYGELIERLAGRVPEQLGTELQRTMAELDRLIAEHEPDTEREWAPGTG